MARGRGRPVVPKATAGDAESIINKIEYELDKFDSKMANELGSLLEAYYSLAFTAEKENTKKAVLEKLIERAQKKVDDNDTDSPRSEKPVETQAKANGTTGEVISLISTNYDEEK